MPEGTNIEEREKRKSCTFVVEGDDAQDFEYYLRKNGVPFNVTSGGGHLRGYAPREFEEIQKLFIEWPDKKPGVTIEQVDMGGEHDWMLP